MCEVGDTVTTNSKRPIQFKFPDKLKALPISQRLAGAESENQSLGHWRNSHQDRRSAPCIHPGVLSRVLLACGAM